MVDGGWWTVDGVESEGACNWGLKSLILPKKMSASDMITRLSQLDPDGFYTYADYLRWQFQERVELIRGKIFQRSPAPNLTHQRVSGNLHGLLWPFFRESSCQLFIAPFDVRLPVGRKKDQDTTVVQPDLCIVCDPEKLDEHGCGGAPDLIVEILSPGNTKREMREKFRVYEEAGVREYWLFHPADKTVSIFIRNNAGMFIGLAPAVEGDILQSTIFPDLKIDLDIVFG